MDNSLLKDQTSPGKMELTTLLQSAIEAAQAPACQIVHYFQRPHLSIEEKVDGSPVTIADREAEKMIREVLAGASLAGRSLDILGEENGLEGTGTRFRWVVDPIDGTRSFVQGIPLFGTIVALEDTHTHQPFVGVIHLPMLKTTYAAARGMGSTRNNVAVRVSQASNSKETMVSVGDPAQFASAELEDALHHLQDACPYLRGYTDCFGHGLVVSGAIGAMVDPALNPWDILATKVLIEEAGGTILLRASASTGKMDALFGSAQLVEFLAGIVKF